MRVDAIHENASEVRRSCVNPISQLRHSCRDSWSYCTTLNICSKKKTEKEIREKKLCSGRSDSTELFSYWLIAEHLAVAQVFAHEFNLIIWTPISKSANLSASFELQSPTKSKTTISTVMNDRNWKSSRRLLFSRTVVLIAFSDYVLV